MRSCCFAWIFFAAAVHLAAASQAELVVQTGLDDAVSAVFSPDGRLILTAGENVAVLWDAAGVQLRTLAGHSDLVKSAVFSPSGAMVLTASADGTARLWDIATGKETRRITQPQTTQVAAKGLTSAVFSPDGAQILTGEENGRARLYDAGSGKLVREFVTTRAESAKFVPTSPTCVAFSPDGARIATTALDGNIQLWDVHTGMETRRLTGQAYPRVRGLGSPRTESRPVLFSPDGRFVLAGGRDATPRLWDGASGVEVRRFAGVSSGCMSMSFSRDGSRVVTADGEVRIWDYASGRELSRLPSAGKLIPDANGSAIGMGDGVGSANSAAFSADGSTLIVGQHFIEESVSLWDANKMVLVRKLKREAARVSSIGFSANGQRLLADGPWLWDLASGGVMLSRGAEIPAALSPDSRRLALSLPDGLILYDPDTQQVLKQFDRPGFNPGDPSNSPCKIRYVAFSPNGQQLLTTAGRFGNDRTVCLWDAGTGRRTATLAHQPSLSLAAIHSAAFSSDGNEVLTAGSDSVVRLWNASSGQQIAKFEHYDTPPEIPQAGATGVEDRNFERRSRTSAAAFTPDGKQVIVAYPIEAFLLLWDKATGKEIRRIEARRDVETIAVSPDGRLIAGGGSDGYLSLWDSASGRQMYQLQGHSARIGAVAFDRDGKHVATASEDGTVRLWSVATGATVATLVGFSNGGWAVTDPQGRFDIDSFNGNAPLHWVISDDPLHALPIDVFTRQYYTPKLLGKIMAGASLPPIRNIAEINRLQPRVGQPIVEPDPRNPDSVRVRVKVAQQANGNRSSGIQDLRVFRNGQLVKVKEGVLKDGEYEFDGIRLPHEKSIEFSAYAFNSDLVKSDTATVVYEPRTTPAAVQPRTFVLNVGVNRTQAAGCGLRELGYAAADATRLGEVLAAHLPSVSAKLLASDEKRAGATKESIRAAIAEIAKQATPDDIFLMSFSGHGFTGKDGVFYLVPSDAGRDCTGRGIEGIAAQAISADELTAWLHPLDAGEMVMVIDSCFSAASIEAGDFRPGPMGSKGLGQLAYDKKMRILAASQSSEVSQEFETLRMGLLTYALVSGLEKKLADWQPKDGIISLREWLGYGRKRVPELYQSSADRADAGRGVRPIRSSNTLYTQTPALFDFVAPNNNGVQFK